MRFHSHPADERQLRLPLDEPAAPQPAEGADGLVFFAVLPAPEDARLIRTAAFELKAALGLAGAPRPERVLHVTLHPLGARAALTGRDLARAAEAAAGIRLAPFDLAFNAWMSFGSAGALVLRCDAAGDRHLADLHQRLLVALRQAGLGLRRGGGFTPHLTLLYPRGDAGAGRLAAPIAFPVREVSLVHSLRGRTRYVLLGRWPLAG